ncbi:MAG: hypothetical protein R2831_02955 [Chitinophagaceae bacterium]
MKTLFLHTRFYIKECKYFIAILFTISLSYVSQAQFSPPIYYQSSGGSEFTIQHRPDIADSAYQIFLRVTAACIDCSGGCNNGYWLNYTSPGVVIHDTDIYHFYSYFITNTAGPVNSYVNNNNTTKTILNPFTGDSAGQRIFKNCIPNFNADAIPNGVVAVGNGFANTFFDTFEHKRDIWYDTIIYLPEKSGLWQVTQTGGIPNNNLTCRFFGTGVAGIKLNTNIDSTQYYLGATSFFFANNYISGGIAQINTLVPNSNPYFLSYPTGIFYKNQPAVYKQLAVDPDGDSLVFSSIHMVFPDTFSQGSAIYNNQKILFHFIFVIISHSQDTNYTGYVPSPMNVFWHEAIPP